MQAWCAKLSCLLTTLLLLAGCVAPQPFQSPTTFVSPLAAPANARSFLPIVLAASPQYAAPASPQKGVSLACGYDNMVRLERETLSLRVSWLWNWWPNPPVFPQIESVPCICRSWQVGMPLGGNSTWLLGFNEPEQNDQANLSPEAAAELWGTIETLYPDVALGSPQVVRIAERWLERFYAAYQALHDGRPPRLDALIIHTYEGANIEDYKRQVAYYISLAEKWGVAEVWVTEFTISPQLDLTLRETLTDLQSYIEWLDAQPKITRYAIWTNRVECAGFEPNTFFDTPLYASNGRLTEMGRMYADR